jgi:hypothetical protein
MPLPEATKRRRQTEALLCSQFVAENYPSGRIFIQQYLGPFSSAEDHALLSNSERRAMGTGRRRADAVIVLPDKIVVIESYVHVQLGKLSQLMTYLQLVPSTPELADFMHLPIEGILVGAQRDPILDQMAARFNIAVVIFRPSWVVDYLATVDPRKSRDRKNVDLGLERAQ